MEAPDLNNIGFYPTLRNDFLLVGLSRNGGCRRADHDPFDILCGAKYEACVRAFDDGPIKDTPCRFASLKDCFREVRNAELEKIVVLAIQVDDLLLKWWFGFEDVQAKDALRFVP